MVAQMMIMMLLWWFRTCTCTDIARCCHQQTNKQTNAIDPPVANFTSLVAKSFLCMFIYIIILICHVYTIIMQRHVLVCSCQLFGCVSTPPFVIGCVAMWYPNQNRQKKFESNSKQCVQVNSFLYSTPSSSLCKFVWPFTLHVYCPLIRQYIHSFVCLLAD